MSLAYLGGLNFSIDLSSLLSLPSVKKDVALLHFAASYFSRFPCLAQPYKSLSCLFTSPEGALPKISSPPSATECLDAARRVVGLFLDYRRTSDISLDLPIVSLILGSSYELESYAHDRRESYYVFQKRVQKFAAALKKEGEPHIHKHLEKAVFGQRQSPGL